LFRSYIKTLWKNVTVNLLKLQKEYYTEKKGEKEMKKEMTTLMVLLMALGMIAIPAMAQPTNGPRADYLHIKIYASDVAEFAAFEAGEIQIVDWPLDPTKVDQYSQAPYNASIILAKFNEIGMFEFDINNNETIRAMPDVLSPTSNPYFRAALSCLVDKDYIVESILRGYAARLDGPIMPWMGSYYDPTVHKYEYDVAQARAYLIAGGFADRDGNGIYNYPVGWPGRESGPDLDPLIFYIRADDVLRRKPAGEDYAAKLTAAGIPVDARVVDRSVTAVEVMRDHNFHLYTGGWSLSRDPDWMYNLYHSDWHWDPGPDYNYNNVHDAALDQYLEGIAYAVTIDDAIEATHNAQKRLINPPDDATFPGIAAIIPLWATSGYTAYRRPMAYAVNAEATGTTNGWTMLVSYRTDAFYGHTIDWGFKSDVQMLNPLYSNWVWDSYVLGEIFDGILAVCPYNLALDMPWICSDFETTTYIHPEYGECSRVILTVRDGATWHDGQPVTADDVKFTYDYIKQFPDCWLYSAVADIVNVTKIGSNQVQIDFDVLTVWALHWSMGVYLLPKHIYEGIADPHGFTPGGLPAEQVLIGCGPYKWYQYSAGEYFTLQANRNYFKTIHPEGDVNLDQTCDIYDIIHVAASFGLRRGEQGYDITADVTSEWDLVDIYDLILVAGDFGSNWEPYP